MNLEQIDTSTTAGKALAQLAELLKFSGGEGELQIGREFGKALIAEIDALTPPEVSDTTRRLIDLLVERDRVGRAKYGTTLDRTDLTRDQWLQHMVEELLDGAGYALAAKRPEVP